MKLDVIIPCYNEEGNITLMHEKLSEALSEIKYNLIFVNDGSKDKTIEVIKEYSKKDKRVKYIHFSRNFGKEAAMLAGLKLSTGDYVAIMDADLQDPPSLLPKMLSILEDPNNDYILLIQEWNRPFVLTLNDNLLHHQPFQFWTFY